jgi:hypothetical protein
MTRRKKPTTSRKKKDPTSRQEGEQILVAAAQAGTSYAQDQLDGDYFRDWVLDQLRDAEAMRRSDPESVLPINSPADAKKIARNMLQQLEWDTKRDMEQITILELSGAKGVFDSGSEDWVRNTYGITYEEVADAFFSSFDETLKSPSVRQWLTDLILESVEDVRGTPKSKMAHESASHMIDVFYRNGKLTDEITKIVSRGTSTRSPQRTVEPFDNGLRLRYGPIDGAEYRHLEGALHRRFGNAVSVSLVTGRVDPQTWAESNRHRVRDYVAIDHGGRVVAGPTTDYNLAKRAADRTRGYVKFAPRAREAPRRAHARGLRR